MPFCSNCGKEVLVEDRFCAGCGKSIGEQNEVKGDSRQVVYDGEIHRCPNCGEILDAYEPVCECCGYERRGSNAALSVRIFSEKLNSASSEEEKATVVQSFPIPNNKEDVVEFFILAASSVSRQSSIVALTAWETKLKQCYLKAKFLFAEDTEMRSLDALYLKTNKEIARMKRRVPAWVKIVTPFVLGFILIVALIILLCLVPSVI